MYSKIYGAAAKSRQSCMTLCDPIDGSPPGSSPWDSPGENTGVDCHLVKPKYFMIAYGINNKTFI